MSSNDDGAREIDSRPARVPRWPALIAISVPTALVLFRASPLGPNFVYVMAGIPFLLVFWAVAAFVAAVLAAVAIGRREWLVAIASGLLPVIVLAALIQPLALIHGTNLVGDVIHFEVMRPHYLAQVRALPGTAPKLLVINWGGMIWASGGVVYDESDELNLPAGRQSAAWTERVSNTELSCEGYSVRPLGGHFYLADFPC